jgi:hypothetical protein
MSEEKPLLGLPFELPFAGKNPLELKGQDLASCLVTAFVLDVLLPPPFRPPLALAYCLATHAKGAGGAGAGGGK